jgi:hypothetical protein
MLCKTWCINENILLVGKIAHIKSDDHGKSKFHELGGEEQVPLNICRINDLNDAIREKK